MEQTELIFAELQRLMEPAELETLVLAIKAVKDSPGGYGDVQLEFRKRWLVQASPRVSIRTKARIDKLIQPAKM